MLSVLPRTGVGKKKAIELVLIMYSGRVGLFFSFTVMTGMRFALGLHRTTFNPDGGGDHDE